MKTMKMAKAILAIMFTMGLAFAADHPELDAGDVAYSAENYEKAAALYRKDAELGVISAQVNLAVMYMDGIGVPQDFQQAAKWFLNAAGQGNAEAQYNVGLLYQEGKGLAKNPVEAAKWFHIAKAFTSVENIEKSMTPGQIAESRKLAAEWMENYKKSKSH
ncbi:MAG: hypothetical protein DM484_11075 [Candidatus Methylumidiphilus alinenensis]|uniref:Sel1 repeat family protein n=1 Tax=Candidatus Methylumidiphilus alinenensis TaxID=2202197 RepID=A0A2W4R6C3_9GAMM|nr:MAG: hypothetical protein DM484_11075 [Candidatus Methylumidiphilus alinenensis]